jgi:hypothetical protein
MVLTIVLGIMFVLAECSSDHLDESSDVTVRGTIQGARGPSDVSIEGEWHMPLPPNRMDYSPMIDRPIIKWPHNARVAFWVAPNIEHYEYMPPMDGVRNPWPRTPHPDVQQYSSHEFGNRVGFWRLLDILDHYDIKCSTTLGTEAISLWEGRVVCSAIGPAFAGIMAAGTSREGRRP